MSSGYDEFAFMGAFTHSPGAEVEPVREILRLLASLEGEIQLLESATRLLAGRLEPLSRSSLTAPLQGEECEPKADTVLGGRLQEAQYRVHALRKETADTLRRLEI